MRTDVYTKVVLTVIAVALIGILAQNMTLTPTAHAQYGVETVKLAGHGKNENAAINVRIVGVYNPLREPWEALKTKSTSSSGTVDVNIMGIGGVFPGYSLPVTGK